MYIPPPSNFRASIVNILALCLSLSPLWALPTEGRTVKETNPTPPKAASAVPQITQAHKGGELLVKFRFGVPDWAKQQVKDTWAKESKELKGKKGVEKLKIKDGAALNQRDRIKSGGNSLRP